MFVGKLWSTSFGPIFCSRTTWIPQREGWGRECYHQRWTRDLHIALVLSRLSGMYNEWLDSSHPPLSFYPGSVHDPSPCQSLKADSTGRYPIGTLWPFSMEKVKIDLSYTISESGCLSSYSILIPRFTCGHFPHSPVPTRYRGSKQISYACSAYSWHPHEPTLYHYPSCLLIWCFCLYCTCFLDNDNWLFEWSGPENLDCPHKGLGVTTVSDVDNKHRERGPSTEC